MSRSLPRWRRVRLSGEDAAESAWWTMPDFGGVDDFAAGIAIFVGVIVVVVVLIPLLLFGIELIIVGLVIAAGILGRGVLGRPWVVQATPAEGAHGTLAWKVVGWRRSARLMDEVATALASGLEPAPAESAEEISAVTNASGSDPARVS
jgi:hypothetical protein